MRPHSPLTALACLIWLMAYAAPASSQANFYEGKTINVMIGAKSGSLDIASQIVAHHLGKHLPGKPSRDRAANARCGALVGDQ